MKNTIVKFETEELEEFIVPNYFSKNIHITDLLDTLNIDTYFSYYQMTNNDKLERISYELYGTPDYWDILFLLNKRDPLFDIPFDYDTVYNSSTSFIDTYINYIYSNAPLSSIKRSTELQEEFLNMFIEQNEIYRVIRVVRPSKIGEFIKLLKKEGYL